MMFDYLSYLLLVAVVVVFLSAAIRILREYASSSHWVASPE